MRIRWAFINMIIFAWAGMASAAEVKEIRIDNRGAGAIDEQYVLAQIKLKVGATYQRTLVSEDVKALQKTGRFSYVGAEFEKIPGGLVVSYILQNKFKLIGVPDVKGEKEVSKNKIRSWLGIEAGDLFDEDKLALGGRKIKEEYAKRYYRNTRVTWDIKKNMDDATASLLVIIEEGKRRKVSAIEFVGNNTIGSWTLRKTMQQKKMNPFSFLTKAGLFKPDELKEDLLTLSAMYKNKGYLDVQIGEPLLEATRGNRIRVVIPIDEGQVYKINRIDLEGVAKYPLQDVRSVIAISSGDIASIGDVERSAMAIRDYYGSRGYILTRVTPDYTTDLKLAQLNVVYRVHEGELAYIGDIRIRGNTRTKDKVIRREMVVYPGDIFNEVNVRRSQNRIRNLGYFSFVNATPEKTADPEKYDLTLKVEEKKTGQFIVGFGFSSIDNLIGFVEVSQANFDIKGYPHFTGGGQKLRARAQLGTERRDIEVGFTEPWFLDRKLSLNVDAFQHDRRFLSDDYDQRNTGGRIGLGRALPGQNRATLFYSFELIDVFDVSENASEQIQVEEGERSKSAMTLRLTHDTRDNYFVSTKGNRTVLSGELAGGPFAGETDIYKVELRTSQYYPVVFDHVFSLRGSAAYAESYGDSVRVPIFDRLFLGGARTLRGFKFRDVGPKDENGEPLGGKTSWYATAEYTVPFFDKFRTAVFYDMGMVGTESFEFGDHNSDFGLGLRLDMPGFPLRIDYAWPLEADEYNDRSSGRFNILLGHVF